MIHEESKWIESKWLKLDWIANQNESELKIKWFAQENQKSKKKKDIDTPRESKSFS